MLLLYLKGGSRFGFRNEGFKSDKKSKDRTNIANVFGRMNGLS